MNVLTKCRPKHIHRIDRNKSPLKISGKSVGVLRDSRIFRAPIYRAHCAVIFATAQLSCLKVYDHAITLRVSDQLSIVAEKSAACSNALVVNLGYLQ